jgi:hypothetical protein
VREPSVDLFITGEKSTAGRRSPGASLGTVPSRLRLVGRQRSMLFAETLGKRGQKPPLGDLADVARRPAGVRILDPPRVLLDYLQESG